MAGVGARTGRFIPRPGFIAEFAKSDEVKKPLLDIARKIASEARRRYDAYGHPYAETGETVESIGVDWDITGGSAAGLVKSEEYPSVTALGGALWLEFGSRHQESKPFMRPAADAVCPGNRRGGSARGYTPIGSSFTGVNLLRGL